ncbi:hypothetical protein HMPREF9269_0084 [Ligilactobacillus salivarius ACS-116-V-Col5a]|nr:DUF4044 domain-containing protein [Ligilactobacillus salivarius]EFK79689.1 hypothetical protein HMPREF9269_0084 [Ligilactobacillus salivarius ACS-116-V-Col5a]
MWLKKTKKERSTFQKITLVVVWLMLIFTIGSVVLSAIASFMN